MGYRSQVYLKTTTEGWLVLKKFNDSIENPDHRPLQYAEIQKTSTGFYKIYFDDIKWYEGSFPEVDNFMNGLEKLEEQDIPYSFIRIGEDVDDIEHKRNWTEDMPYEIEAFEPVIDVNDEDSGRYEDVDLKEGEKDMTHITKIMFDLFDKYEECDDIKNALRNMNSDGDVSDEEYDFAVDQWDNLLKIWEAAK